MSEKTSKAKTPKKPKARSPKPVAPTGVPEIDDLATLATITIQDYVRGVSAYIRASSTLAAGPKKASQIRLSNALARALADALAEKIPEIKGKLVTQERKVAGGLRTVNADVSETHDLDGLRLAVELKPINLAVGRAIWNRFGDIRTFAVNIHLKFRFAVVGGVLAIPTYEEIGTKAAKQAAAKEAAGADDETSEDTVGDDTPATASAIDGAESTTEAPAPPTDAAESTPPSTVEPARRSTVHLIQRAVDRLVRAGGRRSEADADHLLEGIGVVVFDPDTATIDSAIPPDGSALRWEEFVDALATAYRSRFEF